MECPNYCFVDSVLKAIFQINSIQVSSFFCSQARSIFLKCGPHSQTGATKVWAMTQRWLITLAAFGQSETWWTGGVSSSGGWPRRQLCLPYVGFERPHQSPLDPPLRSRPPPLHPPPVFLLYFPPVFSSASLYFHLLHRQMNSKQNCV